VVWLVLVVRMMKGSASVLGRLVIVCRVVGIGVGVVCFLLVFEGFSIVNSLMMTQVAADSVLMPFNRE